MESLHSDQPIVNTRTNQILALFPIVMGVFVWIGYLMGVSRMVQPLPNMVVMNPLTALCFVLTGSALLTMTREQKSLYAASKRWLLVLVLSTPFVLAFLVLVGVSVDETFFGPMPGFDRGHFLMPRSTAVEILLVNIGAILTINGTRKKRLWAIWIEAVGWIFALLAIIGYSYGVTSFGDVWLQPMALHSAIAFIVCCYLVLRLNADVGFMSTIMSNRTGGMAARVLIPLSMGFGVAIGYTRLFIESSFPFPIELGISSLLTFFISLFAIAVVFLAKRLNQQDERRVHAENRLEQINIDLEKQVLERTRKLEINEQRYKAIIDHSIDGLMLTDEKGAVMYQTPSAERITGFTKEERASIDGFSLIHPDDIAGVMKLMGDVRHKPGEAVAYQWRVRHKDGHYFWMEGVGTNMLDFPYVNAIVNSFRDVTERKKWEERLEWNERRFRALIDSSSDAILLTDSNLKVLYQSTSVEKMTGISLEHRNANPGARYTYQDDLLLVQDLIEKSKAQPAKAVSFACRLYHLFGHVIWIEGTITNLLQEPAVNALVFNFRDVTERKNLEAQQALLASLVNSSTDAIISKSLDGVITSWNKGAQALFGYTPSEAIGESVMILVPPELRNEEAGILDRIRSGQRIETFETRRVKKDGSVAFITMTASPIRNSEGDIIGASHISHDITERIQNERRLRGERSMLRTLIDNIPDYIYVKDQNSKHIINNRAMVNLVGATTEAETLGRSSIDFFGDGVAAGYLEEDRQIMASGKAMVNFEESTTTKDGELKYLLTTKVPLTDDQGKAIGIVGISRDITRQKRIELDLRNSKYFLERAQQVAHIGHWTLQAGPPATSKIYLSKEVCRIFECDPDKFDGKLSTFLAFVHPDDRKDVSSALSSALVNQVPYSLDHRLLLPSGEKWVHVQTEATIDSEEQIPTLLGIIQDITLRKQIESEIMSLNAELEQKVQERTSQLKAVNQELEAFSYSVSHDLRAPLRIIDGFATILLEDAEDLDEHIVKNVKTIARNANRMGQLIDDLLNFSRLGRTQLKVGDVDMRAIVEQVLEELQVNDTNVKVTILHVDHANGDGSLLKQVWVNLLSNAIKYSSKKSTPEIEVGMVTGASVPTWYVKDNGAGFNMDYVSKLFGVFQRLHKQDEFDGTGVGLALVQRIVVRHGGKVWGEGKPSAGATFFFTLGT